MATVQDFNENEDKDKTLTGQTTGGGGPVTSPMGGNGGAAPTAASAGSPRQGSGRFTNIQKYLSANAPASERISSGIENKLQNEQTNTRSGIDKNLSDIAAGIQAGKQSNLKGQGYQQQIGATDFDPTKYNNDQVGEFIKYRTGQAYDPSNTMQQQQQTMTSQQEALKKAQDRANQVATEQGRFGLLQEVFGGPKNNYTSGQQKLDNLFFQAGGGNSVNKLQELARGNVQGLAGYQPTLNQYGTDLSGIKTQQQQIAEALTGGSKGLEESLISGLQSKIPGVNTQRAAERQSGRDFYDTLMNLKDGTLDKDIMSDVGLRDNEMIFNSLKGLGSAANIFNFNERDASGVSDVANQADLDRYTALANLAFGQLGPQGQVTVDPSQKRLTELTPLEAARETIRGKDSLRARIDNAQQNFLTDITNRTIKGSGTAGSGSLSANTSARVGDMLGLNPGGWQGVNWNPKNTKTISEGTHWADPIDMSGRFDRIGDNAGIAEAASGITDTSRAIGDQAGEFVGNVIGTGFDPFGGSGAKMSTAQLRAENNLQSNLAELLDQIGAYNIVNSGGITKGERGDWKVDGAKGVDWMENFNIGQSSKGLPKGTAIKGGVNLPGGGQNRTPKFTYTGDQVSTMKPEVTKVISAEEARKRGK